MARIQPMADLLAVPRRRGRCCDIRSAWAVVACVDAWQATGGIWAFVALVGAALALITVYCTGMIYQSLKPIQAWATGWTTPIYLLFALMTGAHAVAALAAWFGYGASWQASAALTLTVALAIAKFMYWRSVETATPFSPRRKVRRALVASARCAS